MDGERIEQSADKSSVLTSLFPFFPPLSLFPSLHSFLPSKEGGKAGGQRMEPTQMSILGGWGLCRDWACTKKL